MPESDNNPVLAKRRIYEQLYDLGDIQDDVPLILNKGKFELEPLWVVVYYDFWLDEGANIEYVDPDGVFSADFILDTDDKAAFPELRSEVERLRLIAVPTGFIHGLSLTKKELELID